MVKIATCIGLTGVAVTGGLDGQVRAWDIYGTSIESRLCCFWVGGGKYELFVCVLFENFSS